MGRLGEAPVAATADLGLTSGSRPPPSGPEEAKLSEREAQEQGPSLGGKGAGWSYPGQESPTGGPPEAEWTCESPGEAPGDRAGNDGELG